MMYKLLKNVKGMSLAAQDGELGRVTDVYFDDAEWTCRYLVVKTGSWLSLKQVLVTPHAIRGIDWSRGDVQVELTREQIRRSPDIDADKPVTRQNEMTYFDYYGYPRYWAGPHAWGPLSHYFRSASRSERRRDGSSDARDAGSPCSRARTVRSTPAQREGSRGL